MRVAGLVLILVCVSLAAAGPEPAAPSPPMLTLRITSATGQESAFEGTLAYAAQAGEDAKVHASWNSGRIVIMNVDKNTGRTDFAGL